MSTWLDRIPVVSTGPAGKAHGKKAWEEKMKPAAHLLGRFVAGKITLGDWIRQVNESGDTGFTYQSVSVLLESFHTFLRQRIQYTTVIHWIMDPWRVKKISRLAVNSPGDLRREFNGLSWQDLPGWDKLGSWVPGFSRVFIPGGPAGGVSPAFFIFFASPFVPHSLRDFLLKICGVYVFQGAQLPGRD